ncbi:hypothetical protein EON64_08060 [archaeon]|nr:MAG: hypothetical protein EON64_08060 [archaeon]
MVISKLFYGAVRESTPSTSPPKHISEGSYVWGHKTEGGVAQSPSQHASTPTRAAVQQLNIKSSQQFRETLRSMNFQFSSEELFDAVFEARKVTIMRTLLHDLDKTSTQRLISQLLEKELHEKHQKNEIAQDSNFLPVKSCFAILENCEEIRLNRAQVCD